MSLKHDLFKFPLIVPQNCIRFLEIKWNEIGTLRKRSLILNDSPVPKIGIHNFTKIIWTVEEFKSIC